MNRSKSVNLLAAGVTFFLPNLAMRDSAWAIEAPSLGDGIICVAKGKVGKGPTLYFYTSLIDDASIWRKNPVSVTILEPTSELAAGDVLVIDKAKRTVTIDNFAFADQTTPEMTPMGLAMTTYAGADTFSGKSQAGTPLSFTLSNNYRTFKLKHGQDMYMGVCH